MAISVARFIETAAAVGVLDPNDAAALKSKQQATLNSDAAELVRELVRQGKLTKFQAAALYQEKGTELLLGNYLLSDKLGAGGMGQVYRARHRRMDRVVALKVLPKKALQTAGARERFQREVKAAAQLTHPNIVTAYDADEASGTYFLVMEYVEGSDLSSLVKKQGPLSVDQAVKFMLQAARGLEHAHKRGIVHRDVKPSNLLVDSAGTVKVLDMGLARFDEGATQSDVERQAELTAAGSLMGTVDYMAPEQALDSRQADARSDVYSLGCTWHYLLLGRPPFGGDTLMKRVAAHQQSPIPSLSASRPGMPAEADRIFKRMLAKSPSDRYASLGEVIADWERLAAGGLSSAKAAVGGQSATVAVPPSNSDIRLASSIHLPPQRASAAAVRTQASSAAPLPQKRSAMPWVLAGSVVLVALAAGGYWMMSKDASDSTVAQNKDAPPSTGSESTAADDGAPIGVSPMIDVLPAEIVMPIAAPPAAVVATTPSATPSSEETATPSSPTVEPQPVEPASAAIVTDTAPMPLVPPLVPAATSETPPDGAVPLAADPLPTPDDSLPPMDEAPVAPPKLPTPTAEAVAASDLLIRDIFKVELTAAKTLETKTALGEKFLQQAAEQRNDPPSYYAMLVRARDTAIEVGSPDLADRSIAALIEVFEIDAPTEQIAAFEKMAQKTFPTANYLSITASASAYTDRFVIERQWDAAKRMSETALNAARKSRDTNVLKQATELNKSVGVAKQTAETVAAAEKTLEQSPDDPAAHLVVGKFLAFNRYEWSVGFEHLAKSNDATLKTLAEMSLAASTEATARVELGDAWWDAGEKAKPTDKPDFRTAAGYWYSSVVEELTGLSKSKVEKRLAELESAAGARPKPGAAPTSTKVAARNDPSSKLPVANGISVPEVLDCAEKMHTLQIGETFDVRKSWLVMFEFKPTKFEKETQQLLIYDTPKGRAPFAIVLAAGRLSSQIYDSLAHDYGKQIVNRVEAAFPENGYGFWHSIAMRYDADGNEYSLALDGRIVDKKRLTNIPNIDRVMPLLVGWKPPSNNRFDGQVRNLWVGNLAAVAAPAKPASGTPKPPASSTGAAAGRPAANGLWAPALDCAATSHPFEIGPSFDVSRSWTLMFDFKTAAFEKGTHDILYYGTPSVGRAPIMIRLNGEEVLAHALDVSNDQTKDSSNEGKVRVTLPASGVGAWHATVLRFDAATSELSLTVDGQLTNKTILALAPRADGILPVRIGGKSTTSNRFTGQVRNLWLGNLTAAP